MSMSKPTQSVTVAALRDYGYTTWQEIDGHLYTSAGEQIFENSRDEFGDPYLTTEREFEKVCAEAGWEPNFDALYPVRLAQ
jgi:hypothetical protein